jgi:histidyl-tRNA synthetase
MRDFLPADVRKRDYVIGVIKEVYESYGFEPLETPAVENIDTLMGKYGEEGNQLIFKILKRGEKLSEVTKLQSYEDPALRHFQTSQLSDLALRYDLTVPLARVVANNRNELPKFFKRYQIQPVWRADRPARGRFREFYQCDVDAIGSESMVVEAEIIGAAISILERLGFDDFTVRINNRKLLSQMVASAGIENETDALVALDKLDKIGVEGVKNELTGRGVEPAKADAFLAAVTGSISHPELDRLLKLCDSTRVKIDPSLARGLS